MKKLTVLIASILLASCATTQPQTGLAKPPQLPELSPELSTKATKLPKIPDNTMGTTVLDGVAVDQQYNKVAHQLNSLIDAYNCIRISIDRIAVTNCFTNSDHRNR